MSVFSVEDILDSTVSGRMATRRKPVPAGEHVVQVKDIKGQIIPQKDKETGMEVPTPIIDVVFELTDPNTQEYLKMTVPPTVQRRIYLNVDEKTGKLDLENNTILGQLREACGQNEDEEWKVNNLLGASCMVHVEHNAAKDNPDIIYANVTRFSPAP